MMIGDVVIFRGLAWPAVRVVERQPIETKYMMTAEGAAPVAAPKPWVALTLATSGHGRTWNTREPRGFWRDLADFIPDQPEEMALIFTPEEMALRFVAKYGDPADTLGPDSETNTATWFGLAIDLHDVAQAWDPVDASGTSQFTSDRRKRGMAAHALERLMSSAGIKGMSDLVPDPAIEGEIALKANSLKAYLALSALLAFGQRWPMRRCATCGSWFTFERSTARYCSPSCRAMIHAAVAAHLHFRGTGRQQGEG
jgi:hypothetical protein